MLADVIQPTPYPDVNAILHTLLSSVQDILGNHFVGMYLYGSLAIGDFNAQSDIDFVVVTGGVLSAEKFQALQAMHARVAASGSKWATEIEGSYIPQRALRRHDPADALHPHIDRGQGESLRIQQHDSDWIIQRYVLRERGVTLAGPGPQTLIDPIHPNELRQAVLTVLWEWWAPMLHDPVRLYHDGYHVYAILTICRMLYTLQRGTVVSKTAAARWAQAELDGRWSALIERAVTWNIHRDDLNETLDFMRYTLECKGLSAPGGEG